MTQVNFPDEPRDERKNLGSLYQINCSTTADDDFSVVRIVPDNITQRSIEDLGLRRALHLVELCYTIVLESLEALVSHNYSQFDAQTTTRCCHGVAFYASRLIEQAREIDLRPLINHGRKALAHIQEIQPSLTNNADFARSHARLSLRRLTEVSFDFGWRIPRFLLCLSKLYLLTLVKHSDSQRKHKTQVTALQRIAPLSTRQCKYLVTDLQTELSNFVAHGYAPISEQIDSSLTSAGVSLPEWSKYVSRDYLRFDKFGRSYASNLFSMQVLLASLKHSQRLVALVADIYSPCGDLRHRYPQLLLGDGSHSFRSVETGEASYLNPNLPVVTFNGCSYASDDSHGSLKSSLTSSATNLDHLVLACDTRYPQFPKVPQDPNFNSNPIIPHTPALKRVIRKASQTTGVCTVDPTFFCLTHIFPASIKELLALCHGESTQLPISQVERQ